MDQAAQFRVIKPTNIKPKPNENEEVIASLMVVYFCSDIKFVPRAGSPTPDIEVQRLHQRWEIKSPTGNSKNTIHNSLKGISRQSENVIVSLLRSDMHPQNAIGRIKQHLERATRIKRLLVVTKSKKILVIK